MLTVHLPSPVADHVSVPPPIPPHRGGSDDLDKEALFTPSLKTNQVGKPNSRRETKLPSEDEEEIMMMTSDRTNKESLKCPISNDYEEIDLPPPLHISSALMSGITTQAYIGLLFEHQMKKEMIIMGRPIIKLYIICIHFKK